MDRRCRAILSPTLFFSDDLFAIVEEVVDVFGFLIARHGIEQFCE